MENVAPRSVRLAVIGVFVQAALNLLGLWAVLGPGHQNRMDHQIHDSFPGNITGAQLDTARTASTIAVAVGLVAMAAILTGLGRKLRGGRRWARTAVTVIVILGLLYQLRTLLEPARHLTLVGQLIAVTDLVVRVAVLALLWAPEDARSYFRRPTPAKRSPGT